MCVQSLGTQCVISCARQQLLLPLGCSKGLKLFHSITEVSVGASSLNLGYCQQGTGAALSVSGRVFKTPRREISQPLCATYISEVLPPCDFSPPQYPIFFKLQIVSSVAIMLLDIAAKNLALQSLKKSQTKQTPTNQKATLIRLL